MDVKAWYGIICAGCVLRVAELNSSVLSCPNWLLILQPKLLCATRSSYYRCQQTWTRFWAQLQKSTLSTTFHHHQRPDSHCKRGIPSNDVMESKTRLQIQNKSRQTRQFSHLLSHQILTINRDLLEDTSDWIPSLTSILSAKRAKTLCGPINATKNTGTYLNSRLPSWSWSNHNSSWTCNTSHINR